MISEEELKKLKELGILFLDYSKLIIGQKIAQGGFAKIFKGSYIDIPVAIKKLKNFDFDNFYREINIMRKVRHPFVPKLLGICINKKKTEVIVLTEFVNGKTLDKYISANLNIDRTKTPSILLLLLHMIDLASVLQYCHGIHLIHRDLKPGNVMIDDTTLELKLLDFGISKFSRHSVTDTEVIGSTTYMAPECFRIKDESGQSSINTKVDIWAFGLILYELFSSEKLYENFESNMQIQSFLISDKDYPVDKISVKDFRIFQICEQCLKSNVSERPNIGLVKKQLISAMYHLIDNVYEDVSDSIGDVDQRSSMYFCNIFVILLLIYGRILYYAEDRNVS